MQMWRLGCCENFVCDWEELSLKYYFSRLIIVKSLHSITQRPQAVSQPQPIIFAGDVILLLPVILVPRSELSRPVRGRCVVCPSHIGLSVSYYYGISRMFRPRIRTRMRQRRDGRRTVCIGTCWNGFTVMSIGVVESPRVKPITIIFGTKCANFQSDGRVIMCSFGRSDSAYQNLPITNVNSHN